MPSNIETLTLQMSADIRRFEKQMQTMNDVANKRLSQVERSVRASSPRLARAMEQTGREMNAGLRRGLSSDVAVTAIAGILSAQQIGQLVDGYTRFTNQLKVAGLEGQQLASVQDALYLSAQKYGVQLESLGALYGRTSQGAKELGASQSDLLKFTDGVAAAVKIQGGSADQSKGAILQLTQALGGAVVRAEEFNSINEGARPILQAVADNIDKYGGSVAKLRADVIDGKVTSQAFFQALLAGTDELQAKASKANLTIAASFQILNNALGKYLGQTDQTLSATARIADAMKLVADNVEILVPAITVIATLIGARYVAGLVTATAATTAQALATASAKVAADAHSAALARNVGMLNAQAVAARASATATLGTAGALRVAGTAAAATGGSMLAAFGGPVGVAIAAIALAFGYLAFEISKADAASAALKQRIEENTEALEEQRLATSIAAQEQGKSVTSFSKAETATAALTGETDKLTDAKYRLAAATKAARLEEAMADAKKAGEDAVAARKLAQNADENNKFVATIGYTSLAGINANGQRVTGREMDDAKGKASEWKVLADQATAYAVAARAEVERIKNEPLGGFVPPPTPKPPGKDKKTADPIRREQATERRALNQSRSIEDQLFRAADDLLRAKQQRALTAKEAMDLDLQEIDRDEEARKIDLDRQVADRQMVTLQADQLLAKKKITKEEYDDMIVSAGITEEDRKRLDEAEKAVFTERRANVQREGLNAIRDEQRRAEEMYLDMSLELLQLQSGAAKTAAERRKLELDILGKVQQRARDQLEEDIRQDQQKIGGPTFDYDKARAQLGEIQAAQTADVMKRTQGPLEQWREENIKTAADIQEAYEQVAADGLDSLTDGMVDIITGTKTVGQAFSEMANSIIADLARIAIQKYITGPLGDAMFGAEGRDGTRSGGWLDGLFSGGTKADNNAFSDVKKYATGTQNHPGGLAYVHKDELVDLPRGSKVHTKAQTKRLMDPSKAMARAPSIPDTRRMLSRVSAARSQPVKLTMHSTYQMQGVVTEQAVRSYVKSAHDSAVSKAEAKMKKMFPGLQAGLGKLGTT